jgi:hypothetical protein
MVFGEGEMKAVRYVWLGLYSVLGIFFVLRFDLIKGLYDPWSWLLLGVIIIFIYPITFGIIFALSGRNIAISSTSNLKKAAIIVWLALGFTSLIFVVVKYFHESYWLSLGAMIFIAGALIGLIAIWILAELVASLILNTRIRTLLFLIAFVTFFAARVLGVTKAITELLEGSPAG